MRVRDLLGNNRGPVHTITPMGTVLEAMARLIEHKISCLPVLDEGDDLIGIVSDKDIFRLVFENRRGFEQVPVSDIMSTNLIVGLPDDDLNYIASVMTENRVRHIPIVDGPRLIGLVSQGDIVKKQLRDTQFENRYLRAYIQGDYPA
jgi:CBS domain-containing protein